jgi:hypothetical protein
MSRNRPRVVAKLASWSRLPAGAPDAVDQLRQQLQAIGIDMADWRALRLAERALAHAEEVHLRIGTDPEYVKRARLNFALARLCTHLESKMAEEMLPTASARAALQDKPWSNGHAPCVRAHAMDRELRVTVLRRAADIAGGSAALRQRLNVEAHALELWLSDRATVPEWVFLLAVDLVVRDDITRAAQDRRTSPREEQGPRHDEIARS